MYKCKHFAIQELVPPKVYEDRGERAWELLDDRMLLTLDELRDEFGGMIVNTWHSERLIRRYGLRQFSGLRTYDYWDKPSRSVEENLQAYLKSYSQHKYGRAFDALFLTITAKDVRTKIKADPSKYEHLKAIEEGITWFHGDVRNTEQLKLFYP